MSIKQFNGQWAGNEDRLLFRFNTQDDREFRFWLTRSVTRTIIQGSRPLVTENLKKKFAPKTAEAIQEFQQQAAVQTTQFNETYAAGANLVLGENPVLVIGVALKAENELMSIDLRLATRQNVNIRIAMAAFQKMVLLLNRLQQQAQWDIGLSLPVAEIQTPETGDTTKPVAH